MIKVLLAVFVFAVADAFSGAIPQEKLNLIEQAVAAMNLKPRLDGYIEDGVAIAVKRIRNDNPGLPDSTAVKIRSIINDVYTENLEGENGLYARLYPVFDKYLSEDDLKFVVQYRGSDGGQRFSQVIPRIVAEGMEIEKKWSDGLRPVILQKLKTEFEDRKLKIDAQLFPAGPD